MSANKPNLKLRKSLSLILYSKKYSFLKIQKLNLIKLISLILFWLLFFIFIDASIIEKEYILLDVKYENEKFILLDKSLEKGNFPVIKHNLDKKYEIKLVSEDGIVLYKNSFDPSFLYSDNPIGDSLSGGVIILNKAEFYIAIPSEKEGNKIEILKNGEKIFEEEIYNVGAKYCRIK